MNPSILTCEPRILGQLLATSSALTSFTEGPKMVEFLRRAVDGVPGVALCAICMQGGERPRFGEACMPACEGCALYRFELGQEAHPSCPLSLRAEIRVLPLRTQDTHYGFLLCQVDQEARFEPYEPFVHNLASSLAVHVERCWRRKQLEAANAELRALRDHLQTLVEKRTEELRAANDRLTVTLRSIGDGVITADTAGTVILMNRVAEELTGWMQDDAAGRPLRDVFRIVHEVTHQPCEDPVTKVLATGTIIGLANHTVLIARDGTERILADSGAPIRDHEGQIIGVVLVFRDVTYEHRREAELVKAQKLESVGLLAGGIAHDFNNLLTAILGNIALARFDVAHGSRPAAYLLEAEKAVGRAKDLTQQLLTFSRGGAPIRKAAHIGETITDSAGFSLRGSTARCAFSIPDDLWPVDADLGQLSQVVSNLTINADEAMPGGGLIRVSARNLPPGAPRPEALPDGRFVVISVEDEGIGIDKASLPRVFDPYFTTKRRGSGLGLATCYSIVRKHEGLMTVDSRQGHGSTFQVFLPATSAEPAPRAADEVAGPGHRRVLVMDDEEMLRNACGEMLRLLGYEVEVAADGAEAIEKYAAAWQSRHPFDVVILDLTVPGGMGGKQAIRKILEVDPGARAIVSSGYANDPVMADFAAYGFRGIAEKPYDLRSLSRALQDVLLGTPQ